MKWRIAVLIGMIILSGLLSACKVKNQLIVRNFTTLYDPDFHPQITGIRVFHKSDSLTDIFIRYNPSTLQYEKKPGRFYYQADYQFSYKIFENYESGKVLLSETVNIFDSLYYQNPSGLVYVLSLTFPLTGNFILELAFTDLNAGRTSYYPVLLIKDGHSSQYFLPVDENNEIIFEDWISWKTRFRIISARKPDEKLFVDHYKVSFQAARPPFSMKDPESFRLIPDETFTLNTDLGATDYLQFGREGIFHFRSDTNIRNGLSLFRFGDDYPLITEGREMVEVLRYLLTEKEYNFLLHQTDPKKAVQEFWHRIANNEERGNLLMSLYLSRAESANRYFTSFKEGWKTDRGMIYMVFGQPSEILRRSGIETWIYGDPDQRTKLKFDFVLMTNPFTQNDYELIRKPEYKLPYYQAVDFWRK